MAIGATARHIAAVSRWYRWFMVVGAILMIVSIRLETRGVLAGFMALWFGASCASFLGRHSERGIWMLSALFLAITALAGVAMGHGLARDLVEGRLGIAGGVEAGIAAVCVVMQLAQLPQLST